MAVHLYPVDTSKGPDARCALIRRRAEGAQQGRHRQAAGDTEVNYGDRRPGPPTVVLTGHVGDLRGAHVSGFSHARDRADLLVRVGPGGARHRHDDAAGSRPPVVRSSQRDWLTDARPRDARTPTGCGAAPSWARTAQLSLWSGRKAARSRWMPSDSRNLPAGRQLCRGDRGSDAGCATGSHCGRREAGSGVDLQCEHRHRRSRGSAGPGPEEHLLGASASPASMSRA